MKKIILGLFIIAELSTATWAHYPSPSDTAGGNMSSSSGHLDLDFLSGM